MVSLTELVVGQAGVVQRLEGGGAFARRLIALGVRPGVMVQVLQRRGSGLVIACGASRVALGGGIAARVLVDRMPDPAPEPSRP